MSVNVVGVLKDSSGAPAPNKKIKFYTLTGYSGSLPSATLEIETDDNGGYDFSLSIGVHALSVQYNNVLTQVDKVTVNNETPAEVDLDDLLNLSVPLTPSEILQVQQLVDEAVAAANSAEEDAAQVALDKSEVAQNTQQVSQDKASVEQTAEEVETAQALIGTSIDGVYANTAAIVSIENTMLKLHPIS